MCHLQSKNKVLLVSVLICPVAHGYPGERKGRDLDHHVERRREPLPGRQTREGETPTNLPRDEKTADSTGPKSAPKPSQSTRVNLGPEWDGLEEGEEAPEGGEPMDAENADDAAMMAMLGFGGFGSTKVCKAGYSPPRVGG